MWPVHLSAGSVRLRPLTRRDRHAWHRLRDTNSSWLAPWEATGPTGPREPMPYRQMVSFLRSEARAGRMLPFAVTDDDVLVGQVTVASIVLGSMRSASIGYWISKSHAGRSIIPTAVALAVDHCFGPAGLHRIEINIRPENTRSLRVVEKLGFRDEGLRERLLHIDGRWRDHRSFALTTEEVPSGLLARWRSSGQAAD